jgi:hypothetical protein
MNISQLERQGADIQSKVEGLELLVSQREIVANDAISQLSDQFVELSTRLQEI